MWTGGCTRHCPVFSGVVDLTVRLLALAALLAAACAFGVCRRMRDGRAVAARGEHTLAEHELGAPLGDRVTLVQISTQFCAPCRAARRVLGAVAASTPGVRHIEVDAERHLGLVQRLDVRRTPTVLLLDDRGRVRRRSVGVPTEEQVTAGVLAVAGSGRG